MSNYHDVKYNFDAGSLTNLDATELTGNLPAISGASLTGLALADYKIAQSNTTSNRTLSGVTGWTQHRSVTFTTTQVGSILCFAQFAHAHETGAVHVHARFDLDGSSQTNDAQVVKQGHSTNHAFGAHTHQHGFSNVSAGSHTVKLQVKNFVAGTTAILNYFDTGGAGDNLIVFYK